MARGISGSFGSEDPRNLPPKAKRRHAKDRNQGNNTSPERGESAPRVVTRKNERKSDSLR